jgi:hypothetical protein
MASLHVRNPSEYPRPEDNREAGEYVFVPWAQVSAADPSLSSETVSARTADGAPVPCDVVRWGADKQALAVHVEHPLAPASTLGAEPLVIELGDWGDAAAVSDESRGLQLERYDHPEPDVVPEDGRADPQEELSDVCRIRMVNRQLNVWFDLGDHFGKRWFAGAASSVQLDALEMLDNPRTNFQEHDPEKRCMQIDLLSVSRPGWECPSTDAYPLFAQRYSLVDYASGPVGVSVTIASPVHMYRFSDPFAGREREIRWILYRRLSLYGGVNYVNEEVWMRGETLDREQPLDLCFTARYFSYMEMGEEPHLSEFIDVPGWRAISMPHDPRQGYGFVTSARTGSVNYPHPGYPNPEKRHRTFSWEVGPCRSYRCMHLFHRSEPEQMVRRTERAWRELFAQPLTVDVVP